MSLVTEYKITLRKQLIKYKEDKIKKIEKEINVLKQELDEFKKEYIKEINIK